MTNRTLRWSATVFVLGAVFGGQYHFLHSEAIGIDLINNLIVFLSIVFGFCITSLSIFSTSSFVRGLYDKLDPNNKNQTLLHALLNKYKITPQYFRSVAVLTFSYYIFLKKLLKSNNLKITKKGKDALKQGASQAIAQLTPEMLSNNTWKDKEFRSYDAGAPAPAIYAAKKNPLRQFSDEVREIFLQMGFSEIKGPIVESSFWNFDALFVPQDHPSRELQDTFYVRSPKKAKKIDSKYSKPVGETHQSGWKTGSTGWGYKWSEEKSRDNVLRTHTTEATCRALVDAAKKGQFPVKVFCIDRVFRNEAIDFKHLAEFHQVEGIVIDDNASLNDLVGILKTFFGKLGFDKVRVRPGYFPYTEPSAEVDIFFEEKGEWLELGGAGIFRPEVVVPLIGKNIPVLAWGQGFDRIIMEFYKIKDLRELYKNDLTQLREIKFWSK